MEAASSGDNSTELHDAAPAAAAAAAAAAPPCAPLTWRPVVLGSTKPQSSRCLSVRKRLRPTQEERDEAPPSKQPSEEEGPFWFEAPRLLRVHDAATGVPRTVPKGITAVERQRLRELLRSGAVTPQFLRTVADLNDESRAGPRLRAYDYAVTNTLKAVATTAAVPRADGTVALVDPYLDATRQLETDHRLLFDFFRRGTRLFYSLDGATHFTTAGQLTAVLWAERSRTREYVEAHADEIAAQMRAAARARHKDGSTARRRVLTPKYSRYCRSGVFAPTAAGTAAAAAGAGTTATPKAEAAMPTTTTCMPLSLSPPDASAAALGGVPAASL